MNIVLLADCCRESVTTLFKGSFQDFADQRKPFKKATGLMFVKTETREVPLLCRSNFFLNLWPVQTGANQPGDSDFSSHFMSRFRFLIELNNCAKYPLDFCESWYSSERGKTNDK